MRYPVGDGLVLAVGGFTCWLAQCGRFAAAAISPLNNQMALSAHLCAPECPVFLFVVLVFMLGQGGVPSCCDRVVHSLISVDRVSVVKIIDLHIGFSIRWLALKVKPQDEICNLQNQLQISFCIACDAVIRNLQIELL